MGLINAIKLLKGTHFWLSLIKFPKRHPLTELVLAVQWYPEGPETEEMGDFGFPSWDLSKLSYFSPGKTR